MSLSSQAPRAFILDFDGTITVKDTIGVLGSFGVEWQGKGGSDMKGVWEEVVGSYGRDFESHIGGYKPAKEDRRTVDEEVQYYRSLREIEERSFRRVTQSGLFRGIVKQDWERAGRQAVEKGDVEVRKGLTDFIEKLKGRQSKWGIVSVNFSGSFIRGVVEASAGPGSEDVEILANESDENGCLLGLTRKPKGESKREFGRVAVTSDAKLALMKDLLESWKDIASLDSSRPIYVGDSGTDIECLIEHGVIGIVMTDDGKSNLMQMLQRIGVELVHIGEHQETESTGKRIYWARDFEEILDSPLFPQT